MKVLLTGGSGFLGCELCNELLQAGHEVVVLDDHSRGKPARLEQFGDTVQLVDGDVRWRTLADTGPHRPDVAERQHVQVQSRRAGLAGGAAASGAADRPRRGLVLLDVGVLSTAVVHGRGGDLASWRAVNLVR